MLFIFGAAAGAGIALVDSRPTWDDTGITVLALLAVSGLLGAISPRRAWLWALAVGIWIPLLAILRGGSYGMLVVLLFPLIGAYAGAGLRWLVQRAVHAA
ncbi:MAG TPA: hypothetical protein VF823_00400 [Anaerolineales bacterium]